MRNEKKQAKSKSKDTKKCNMNRSLSTPSSKQTKDFRSQSFASIGNLRKDMSKQNNPRSQATSIVSARSVRNMNKPVCEHCGKNHFEECRLKKEFYF